MTYLALGVLAVASLIYILIGALHFAGLTNKDHDNYG